MPHLFGFAVYSCDYSLQSPVLPPMYSQNVGIRKLWNRYPRNFERINLQFFFVRRRRRMGASCLSNLPRSRDDSNLDFDGCSDSSRNTQLQLALPKQSRNSSEWPFSPNVGRQLPRLPARFYPADAVFIDTVYHWPERSQEKEVFLKLWTNEKPIVKPIVGFLYAPATARQNGLT